MRTYDVHDAAPPLLLHVRIHSSRHADLTHQLEGKALLPVGIAELQEVASLGRTDGVSQNVDTSVLFDDLSDEVLHVSLLGAVRRHTKDFNARLRPDLGRGLREFGLAASADDDLRTLLGQQRRSRPPNSLASSSNEGDFPLQTKIHSLNSPCCN